MNDVEIRYGFLTGCFSSCMEVVLPEDLCAIDDGAFDDCSALRRLVLPERLKDTGRWGLENCGSLVSVTGHDGSSAWDRLSARTKRRICVNLLREGTLSEEAAVYLKRLRNRGKIFRLIMDDYLLHKSEDCTVLIRKLLELYPPSSPDFLESCFMPMLPEFTADLEECRKRFFTAEQLQAHAESCRQLEAGERERTFAEWRQMFRFVSRNGTVTITGCRSREKRIEIPERIGRNPVTEIGPGAFSWCENLESTELPGTLQTIADGAFYHCVSLKKIVIPASVSSIGDAFGCCPELVIHAPAGSFAERYANAAGIPFAAL